MAHGEVQRQVDYLKKKMDAEMEDHRREVEKTVRAAVYSSLYILREEFDGILDRNFSRELENSTILAMITDTMEYTADSHLYLRNLATVRGNTDNVAKIVLETVRAKARIVVAAANKAQENRLEAYRDAKLAL